MYAGLLFFAKLPWQRAKICTIALAKVPQKKQIYESICLAIGTAEGFTGGCLLLLLLFYLQRRSALISAPRHGSWLRRSKLVA